MNVLILTPRYYPNTPGGGARSVHLIAKALNPLIGLEVYSQDGEKTKIEDVEGINVIRKKQRSREKLSMNIRCIKDLMRNHEYDLIHCYNMDLMPAAGFLTKYLHAKSVATLNGRVYSRLSEWYDRYLHAPDINSKVKGSLFLLRNTFLKSFVREINLYSVLCQYRGEAFVREGLDREKFTVIPNILDTSFKPQVPIHGDKVRILYVGSLNWLKGLDVLLQAFSLLEKGPVELVVVGVSRKDAPSYSQTRNPITFKGRLPYEELPTIYAQSDISVNPYRHPEPETRTIMEAMQSGLPVITIGTPAYSPIVRDGIDGSLVYPFTPRTLAAAMQYLIDNSEIRKTMGVSAKAHVEEVCAPKRIAGLYLELYRKALGNY